MNKVAKKNERNSGKIRRSDVGPPEHFDLIPLDGMLEPHVLPHAVGMGKGLGAGANRTGGRVSGIVLV